jgi:hypothetical protein
MKHTAASDQHARIAGIEVTSDTLTSRAGFALFARNLDQIVSVPGFRTLERSYPYVNKKLAKCWAPAQRRLVREGVELSLWAMRCPWGR